MEPFELGAGAVAQSRGQAIEHAARPRRGALGIAAREVDARLDRGGGELTTAIARGARLIGQAVRRHAGAVEPAPAHPLDQQRRRGTPELDAMIAATQMTQRMPESALGRGAFVLAGDPSRVTELEPQSAAIDRERARPVPQRDGETRDHRARSVLHLEPGPQQQRLDRGAARRRLAVTELGARRRDRRMLRVASLPLHPGDQQPRRRRVPLARPLRREGCPLRRAIEAPAMELRLDCPARDLPLASAGFAVATQSLRLDHDGAPLPPAMALDQPIERTRRVGRPLEVEPIVGRRPQGRPRHRRRPRHRLRLAHLRLARRRLAAPERVRLAAAQQGQQRRHGARALDCPPAKPRRARNREALHCIAVDRCRQALAVAGEAITPEKRRELEHVGNQLVGPDRRQIQHPPPGQLARDAATVTAPGRVVAGEQSAQQARRSLGWSRGVGRDGYHALRADAVGAEGGGDGGAVLDRHRDQPPIGRDTRGLPTFHRPRADRGQMGVEGTALEQDADALAIAQADRPEWRGPRWMAQAGVQELESRSGRRQVNSRES